MPSFEGNSSGLKINITAKVAIAAWWSREMLSRMHGTPLCSAPSSISLLFLLQRCFCVFNFSSTTHYWKRKVKQYEDGEERERQTGRFLFIWPVYQPSTKFMIITQENKYRKDLKACFLYALIVWLIDKQIHQIKYAMESIY